MGIYTTNKQTNFFFKRMKETWYRKPIIAIFINLIFFLCLFLLKQPALQHEIIIIIIVIFFSSFFCCVLLLFLLLFENCIYFLRWNWSQEEKQWMQEMWTTKGISKGFTQPFCKVKSALNSTSHIWYHKHYIISNYFAYKQGIWK